MYLLLFRQAEALRNCDVPSQARHAQLQRRLLDEHLGRWSRRLPRPSTRPRSPRSIASWRG